MLAPRGGPGGAGGGRRGAWLGRALAAASLVGGLQLPATVMAQELAIGVLAFRGAEWAEQRWGPTAEYLSRAIPDHRFRVVPLDLSGVEDALRRRSIDFLLTNPGNYVELEGRHGVSRIATLRNLRAGSPYTSFGAVILTGADRGDIQGLDDLRGQSFMAVSPDAFGGFQMAWRELAERGIDPFRDLERLEFAGFPQDGIVYAVREGRVDAGTVRTDILERMASEGKIALDEFKVLGKRKSAGFPFVHSTRLYPEWPFAKAQHTPDGLAQQVVIALLTLPPGSEPLRAGSYAGWTIPLDYGPVHALFRELEIGPYAQPITLARVFERYRHWLTASMAVAAVMILVTVLVLRINRRLTASELALRREVHERMEAQQSLARHRDTLEQRVRERTLALTEDIRARKEVEEELRRSEATLRRMHEITSSRALDFQARVRSLLETGCRHFEMTTGVLARADEDGLELVERVSSDDGPMTRGRVEVVSPFWRKAISSPEVVTLEAGDEGRAGHGAQCPLGACRAYLGTVVLVDGEPFGPLAFLAGRAPSRPSSSVDGDILQLMAQWIGGEMERMGAQELARQRQDEVAHVSRVGTMGEMASGLAHELNQPLTAIVNYTRGCVRRLKSGKETRAALVGAMEQAAAEAERAAEVVRRIRDFLRKVEPRRRPISINEAVREAARMIESQARRSRVQLRLELDEALPPVEADSIQIEQVVLNLARNGLDAIDAEGGPERVLTIRTAPGPGGRVEVCVEDTGEGLPAGGVEEMFHPFVTSKQDGMGMGLSISRSIAEAHGGHLTAEPVASGGALLRMSLPGSEQDARVAGSLRR